MKYDWKKVPGFQELYKKIENNTYNTINEEYEYLVPEFMLDLEEFMYSCFNKNYITQINYNDIMKRLNNIECFNVLFSYDRNKTGFTTLNGKKIFINPGIDINKRRIYVFKELCKLCFGKINDEDFYGELGEYEEQDYRKEGYKLIIDTLAQEASEDLYYDSIDKKRPNNEYVETPKYFDKKSTAYTNYDKREVFKPLLVSFLRVINKECKYDDQTVLYFSCNDAFKNRINDKITAYEDKEKMNKILNMLGKLFIKNTNENKENIIVNNIITDKVSRYTYKNVIKVMNSRPQHNKVKRI